MVIQIFVDIVTKGQTEINWFEYFNLFFFGVKPCKASINGFNHLAFLNRLIRIHGSVSDRK